MKKVKGKKTHLLVVILTMMLAVLLLTACGLDSTTSSTTKNSKSDTSENNKEKQTNDNNAGTTDKKDVGEENGNSTIYVVDLVVDFTDNLLFSKYDVNVLIDGENVAALSHGEDWMGNASLKEGEHIISFCKSDDSSCKGEITIDVKSEMKITYKITCEDGYVDIETIETIVKRELGENEVQIFFDKKEHHGKNYKDVEASFRELGFTNIITKPLYDIYWGITDEESVDYVMIDGRDNYNKGDIFLKDVEVVIPYHMPEEDDPGRQVENTPTSSPTPIPETTPDTSEEEKKEVEKKVLDQPCSSARKELNDLGYSVKYIHANSKVDFTNEIGNYDDSKLDSMEWFVESIDSISTKNKTISLLVNTRENAKQVAEEKRIAEALEAKLPAYIAVAAVERYGEKLYGRDFELNKVLGKLAEKPVDENTWFIKYTCEITIDGVKYNNKNCEAKVTGSEDNPKVYDFYVY